ncbi:MAG TPA: hypothetical protein VGC93_16850 [Thermoanaerobaculia bacterium]|jgi:hypothetical protein
MSHLAVLAIAIASFAAIAAFIVLCDRLTRADDESAPKGEPS